MSSSEVSVWKKRRNITFVNANNEMLKTQKLMTTASEEESLVVSNNKLKAYKIKLDTLSESIAPHVAESELEGFLCQSDEFDEKLSDVIFKAEYQLEKLEKQRHVPTPSVREIQTSSFHDEEVSKLPKLVIQKFAGDPLKWREFWDSFNVAVHAKTKLSSVEKFQYLKSFLVEGSEAEGIVEGYPLTADTYETAVEALKQRFDNPEFSIFAHLDAMISMKEANGKSVEDLRRVFDECEAHIHTLVALGLVEDTFSRVFTPLILSKVPRFIRIELHRRNGGAAWTLANLRKYLKDEISARKLGSIAMNSSHGTDSQSNDSSTKPKDSSKSWRDSKKSKSASSLVSTHQKPSSSSNQVTPKYPCNFCNEHGHFPSDCTKYTTAEARKATLKDNCLLCLRKGHSVKMCRCKTTKCRHCDVERSHHRSLCFKKYPSESQGSVSNAVGLNVHAKEFSPDESSQPLSTNTGNSHTRVVLPTALACIKGMKGQLRVRIILDSAATRSFARLDILKRVGAELVGNEVLGLAGVQAESRDLSNYSLYEIGVLCESGECMPVVVTALKTISCPVDKHAISMSDYPILSKLKLADPLSDKSTEVQLDVIIGLDSFFSFVGDEQIRLDTSLVLLGAKLGYVLAGCTSPRAGYAANVNASGNQTALIAISDSTPDELDSGLERLWRLEDVAVKEATVDDSDAKAEKAFRESIRYDAEKKRYSVGWPWRFDEPELPDNFGLAYGRLKSLLGRLDPKTLEVDNRTIIDQLEKEVVEPAPTVADGPLVHYLPHHCIIRPDKATTKLRVVYDASSKASKSSLSLNDCFYRGPVLLADLYGLLLRFRTHRIGIVSDIEKAFLQILLHLPDRDVTRFLWVKDIAKPPVGDNLITLRFTRVLFGAKPSPYMLGGTVQEHLELTNTPTSEEIKDNCYVDNVMNGREDVDGALAYYHEAKSIFSEAGMNLREWQSNSAEFMAAIPEHDAGDREVASVLGLKWQLGPDSLAVSVNLQTALVCNTKRGMLKAVASIFDPLGVLSPVTICGKILLQKLWELKLDWDSMVPHLFQSQWNGIFQELLRLKDVSFPRTVEYSVKSDVQLHCFCDASKAAYCAAVYLRCSSESTVYSHLLFAKTKVTPLKNDRLTIPRLELTALALGCQVLAFVQKEMKLQCCELFAWTDSQCSLHWVNRNPRSPVYVKNRVKVIRDHPSVQLRYVPTECNPGDLPTRGMKTDLLMSSQLWWKGPEWLTKPSDCWPAMPELRDFSLETDKTASSLVVEDDDVHSLAVVEAKVTISLVADAKIHPQFFTKFSSLMRLVRVTAWIRRFLHKGQGKKSGELSASELAEAQVVLLKMAQHQFSVECPKKFETYQAQLGLFKDPQELFRCSGRLDHADLPYDARYPVFLPTNSSISELIVKHEHESLAHGGNHQVLASIRCRYWLPGSRGMIRRVRHNCRLCKLIRSGSFKTPNPPSLPVFRTEEKSCFASAGLDYLGPLMIRSPNAGPLKVWICLFTCCNSRAIHLEVVEDMTTDQFLMCLRRFNASYGAPHMIVCDNAKQLLAAKNVTDKVWKEVTKSTQLQAFCSNRGIVWKFIVEHAPWFGGFYERMVGIVKKALRSSLHNQLLTLVELQTVCVEVSYIVNTRPLTYCEDEVGIRSLCPNDFITRSRHQFPPIDSSEVFEDPDFKPDSLKFKDFQASSIMATRLYIPNNHPLSRFHTFDRPICLYNVNVSSLEMGFWFLITTQQLPGSDLGDLMLMNESLKNDGASIRRWLKTQNYSISADWLCHTYKVWCDILMYQVNERTSFYDLFVYTLSQYEDPLDVEFVAVEANASPETFVYTAGGKRSLCERLRTKDRSTQDSICGGSFWERLPKRSLIESIASGRCISLSGATFGDIVNYVRREQIDVTRYHMVIIFAGINDCQRPLHKYERSMNELSQFMSRPNRFLTGQQLLVCPTFATPVVMTSYGVLDKVKQAVPNFPVVDWDDIGNPFMKDGYLNESLFDRRHNFHLRHSGIKVAWKTFARYLPELKSVSYTLKTEEALNNERFQNATKVKSVVTRYYGETSRKRRRL